jgi:hypothetical protein
MDAITKMLAGPAAVLTAFLCIAGLLSIGLGVYWLFNKKARLRDIEELRKKLDELRPSDPEYNVVRALYTSMVIDAHGSGFFHSGSESGGDNGSVGHGGGDHVGGDGSGGHH